MLRTRSKALNVAFFANIAHLLVANAVDGERWETTG
jgi:hypothetical protein